MAKGQAPSASWVESPREVRQLIRVAEMYLDLALECGIEAFQLTHDGAHTAFEEKTLPE